MLLFRNMYSTYKILLVFKNISCIYKCYFRGNVIRVNYIRMPIFVLMPVCVNRFLDEFITNTFNTTTFCFILLSLNILVITNKNT